MKYEVLEQKPWMVEEGGQDLRERTKIYALRVIRLYSSLPKTTEAQVIGNSY